MSQQFTNENFQKEVIDASKEKPVLVDFFAPWCGPCKIQGPVVDEVAKEMEDKAIVGKVNTEEAADVSQKYNVMSIPNILLFRNGEVKENMTGLRSKEDLIEIINKYL
ncbi:MAG: thioredoxin [bacterium]